ncbi:vicilin-like seed storage protein At2g18540 isoform X2 [Limulus polyphemus]|uniref:Vicilin-like seed storage protein At2g18540 isoform X2 n=1 Tax=Limulus polyphemus TaxID=6850 RepID=A0ABM1TPT8_LIMPO|nr:vicilin-like seed storage protein At2g18540 isoform X2 [Limulus polyphemus]
MTIEAASPEEGSPFTVFDFEIKKEKFEVPKETENTFVKTEQSVDSTKNDIISKFSESDDETVDCTQHDVMSLKREIEPKEEFQQINSGLEGLSEIPNMDGNQETVQEKKHHLARERKRRLMARESQERLPKIRTSVAEQKVLRRSSEGTTQRRCANRKNETVQERKCPLRRERKNRWMARQSQKRLENIRVTEAEQITLRQPNETHEETTERKLTDTEKHVNRNNETAQERKRRLGRERKRRWMARQSQESLAKIRIIEAQRIALKRSNETPEETTRRRQTDAERHAKRNNETAKERKCRLTSERENQCITQQCQDSLAKIRITETEKIALRWSNEAHEETTQNDAERYANGNNETAQERKRRLGRERKRRWMARQSQESLAKIRITAAQQIALRRSNETREETIRRKQIDSQRYANGIDETIQERKRRLGRERKRRWTARQSQERLARIRITAAQRIALRRSNETPEETTRRKQIDAERHANRYCETVQERKRWLTRE